MTPSSSIFFPGAADTIANDLMNEVGHCGKELIEMKVLKDQKKVLRNFTLPQINNVSWEKCYALN